LIEQIKLAIHNFSPLDISDKKVSTTFLNAFLFCFFMSINYNNKKSKGIIEEMRKNSPKININGIECNMQEVYESRELKKQLVEENPRLAEELYYRWRDSGEQEIGWFFAEKYNGDEQYGASAYHIGMELGVPGIKRPNNPFSGGT
jgi:hypothetical protein